MKRILLIIGIILMLGVSYAQKNLFDLEFDAPLAQTEAMLIAKGFVETVRTSTMITYKAENIPNLISLELHTNPEQSSVAHWKLQYDISSDLDVESGVLDQLNKIHGDYQYEDSYGYDYIWYFPADKALYVAAYENGRMALNYTKGNWEEDDLNFYGWF